jgi:hypothetical protein
MWLVFHTLPQNLTTFELKSLGVYTMVVNQTVVSELQQRENWWLLINFSGNFPSVTFI